jgi:ABC-2 type transport system ATP-binding protein
VDPVIVTTALTKRFGAAMALDGLDLEVHSGEVFGFVGPNGAGKTTTIRLLLDLLRPTAGTVRVFGRDPRRDGVAVRARIGYLPGDLNLPARLTGRSFLSDHAAVRGRSLTTEADALAERFAADLDRPMGELSLGNRRKIGVIAAFVHRPELLVLDEPTGGLDPLVQQEFRALTREVAAQGRTVFLSSHVLDEVQHVADRVAVLRKGRLVVEDRVDALISRLVRTVKVTFAAAPDAAQFAHVPGVTEVTSGRAGELSFVLEGPAGPLLAALAPHTPLDLRTTEADLEDVFLGYYRADGES